MNDLLFANIPHDCDSDDLRSWIEARGFPVNSLRLIRGAVSRSSPSFARVQLKETATDRTVEALHQQKLEGRSVLVRRGRSPLEE